jgi:hypothetical protein
MKIMIILRNRFCIIFFYHFPILHHFKTRRFWFRMKQAKYTNLISSDELRSMQKQIGNLHDN